MLLDSNPHGQQAMTGCNITGRMDRSLETLALDPGYAAAFTIDDQRRMSGAKNYFAWQGQLACRVLGRRVIEVGCGVGNFTEMLLGREAVLALDKEQGCIEQLKQRYRLRANVQAAVCDVNDDHLLDFAAFQADSCVCLNVLEHVHDDLRLLRRMASLIGCGGTMVLLVPAFPSLYGPIDSNLGHVRRYTKRSFQELAGAANLRVEQLQYMNAIGFFGWWANSHIFRRAAQSEKQIEIFDRYLVPLLSRIEDLAPPPFGQSIFAVLQKP
jgi:2-polyprenyl-3-methyl-5-hydroxy-6-metoxy-1,4-benzoquinol methylase